MERMIVRVRPRDGEWQIETNGARVKKLPERAEAVARARELAHMHHGVCLVEDRDNRRLERDDYGD